MKPSSKSGSEQKETSLMLMRMLSTISLLHVSFLKVSSGIVLVIVVGHN